MSDRYSQLVNAPVVGSIAKQVGLPKPIQLDRYQPDHSELEGDALTGAAPGGRLGATVARVLGDLGVTVYSGTPPETNGSSPHGFKALVFDATGITDSTQLVELQRFFHPAVRSVKPSGRVVVLGTPPEDAGSARERTAQRALEGFTRALGKEIGRGATVNLVYIAVDAEDAADSTLRFFLSPRSAYVSAQVVRVAAQTAGAVDWAQPLAGKTALVTGAARGIGAAIAETLERDGARVVRLDIAGAFESGADGDHLELDITADDAPKQIAKRFKKGGLDILVHNAGVTKDRTLAKMPEDRWQSLLEINLSSEERIDDELLAQGVLNAGARIVCLSSIAGIAGNAGQTNYSTSKAGVIGMVQSMAPELAREPGATINAVAPGFIETKMTDAMPFAIREVGRRMNSLSQGGLPQDVAETVAWLASPGSAGVNGQIVRVCGQSFLGA